VERKTLNDPWGSDDTQKHKYKEINPQEGERILEREPG
jgi:hypothetical protein